PDAPFGPAPNYLVGPTQGEIGAEQVYVTHLDRKVANIGAAVILQSVLSEIDPFFLGAQDENTVQGYAGTPVNANGLMFDYVFDAGSGVDPLSLVIGYKRVLVGAAAYDPTSGLALFPLPAAAPRLTGRTAATLEASDFQETKNVNTAGSEIMPNTRFKSVRIAAAARPAVTWLAPNPSAGCVKGTVDLIVAASAPKRIAFVRFYDGKRRLATIRSGPGGLFVATWKAGKARRGAHTL